MEQLGFDRTRDQWRFIYSAWAAMSYAWQAFGILWITWGTGLTVWMFATQDTSRVTVGAMVILGLALVLPSAAMFFGGLRFRRWSRGRLAALSSTKR